MRYVPIYIAAGSVCAALFALWSFTESGNSSSPRQPEPSLNDVIPAAPLDEALARQDRIERQLNAANFNLGSRLRSLEEQLNAERAARQANAASTSPRPSEPAPPSESDFAQWMEDSLTTAARDQAITDSVRAEANTSLQQVPEVELKELECSAQFCRATLVGEEGKPPSVRKLYGLAPFATSGFTIPGEDGRVALYFTRPGEELDSLREQAFREVGAEL